MPRPKWDGLLELAEGEYFTAASAGFCHSAAITSHGRLLTWGRYGSRYWPCPLHEDGTFVSVFAGMSHTVAITAAGHLVVPAKVNARSYEDVPILLGDEVYTHICDGRSHMLALTSEGGLVAWGGDNATGNNVPVLPETEHFVDVSGCFSLRPAAITSNGRLVFWYPEKFGCVEIVSPPNDAQYTAVASGLNHVFALDSKGRLASWGDDTYGQRSSVPELFAGECFERVSAGVLHTVALTSSGRLLAWGSDVHGECRTPVLRAGEKFKSCSAGGSHTVALTSHGRLLAWGSNTYKQCSDTPKVCEEFPVAADESARPSLCESRSMSRPSAR